MRFCRVVFVFVFAMSISFAANAQLLSYTLKREDAYIIGVRIAESIALGMLASVAELDNHLLYDAYAARGSVTINNVTYPTVDISIEITEKETDVREITFSLALASQQAEDGNYYIIGKVLNVMIDDRSNSNMARLNGRIYAETEEDVVPVRLVNGAIEIAN